MFPSNMFVTHVRTMVAKQKFAKVLTGMISGLLPIRKKGSK